MPAINLKDFFCRYTTDKFIDVSEKGLLCDNRTKSERP